MTASAEVQKAIYEALIAVSVATQVRDTPIAAPGAADFPFIEIGPSQQLPDDAGGDTGIEEFVDVHCYSRAAGQREVKDMMGAIHSALHHRTLVVAGRETAHCWFDGGRVLVEPDGLTRHGVQTFRIVHRS